MSTPMFLYGLHLRKNVLKEQLTVLWKQNVQCRNIYVIQQDTQYLMINFIRNRTAVLPSPS